MADAGTLLSCGVWLSVRRAPAPGAQRRPGLFLDRDGVLVEEVHYLSRPEDARLSPGAVELLRAAHARGVPVAVATNQSGIDRGYFDWEAYRSVEAEIDRLLAAEGVWLDAVAACPFHADHTPCYAAGHAAWRKPGPKMIELLAETLAVDPGASWMIGDKASDAAAARAAGLAGAVHLLTGHGRDHAARAAALATAGFPVHVAADLEQAARLFASMENRL